MLVEIENLSKSFSSKFPDAIKKISTTIPQGQIVGLIGPDGSGKTTLIRLMAGLMLPTEGSIRVAGKETRKDALLIHYLTGYMPQRFGLYEDLTVQQNLDLYADLKGVVGEERKEALAKLLKFTGLELFTKRLAKNLSGGMKQKLGLACALIKKPTLLLLDEPSVGVDPISRRDLWEMMGQLLDEGISIVWSTAYLDEAEKCDSVLLINSGELLYAGKPEKLTEKIEGRVFKITPSGINRRELLFEIMKQENVVDCVVMGSDVRVLFKQNHLPASIKNFKLEAAAPRFEDAFIDILGGAPKQKSKLAEIRPEIGGGSEVLISVRDLTKKFGDFTAVDKVSCEVRRGEIFGLLGPNGAGKSTTFKMLCGLLRPTEGKAMVKGLDLRVNPAKAREHVGYMAQKFSLYGNLTVRQNLEFFSGIYNLNGRDKEEVIDEMIEIFFLKDFVQTDAALLPLGFKQRLSLACATMHNPEIIFLDEPTSGVDPIMRREFWNHINGLVEKGVTIMITTHFMDEAEYCDRIALIYKGKIIHMDMPDKLKEIARSEENPQPSLEDAFIKLIKDYDLQNGKR